MRDVVIDRRLVIPAGEIDTAFARSGGPGGQNVNKVASKVELRWIPGESAAVRSSLHEHDRGWLFPTVDEYWRYGYYDQIRHFVECVRTGTTPKVTFADGVVVNRAFDMKTSAGVALTQGRDGRLAIDLRDQHYAEGIGWFDQRTLALDPRQFRQLKAVLGLNSSALEAFEDESPATIPFPGPSTPRDTRPAVADLG